MTDIRNIDVFFSMQSFQEDELRGKTVVIIDILRATSTITTALNNGAKKIIPVEDMGEATKISHNIDSDDFLLCGEKDGHKIDGFDLGNNPLEYTPETVGGKTIILNTTNGTKSIKKASGALNIFMGSFLNLEILANTLRNHDEEIVLICAGWKGRISFEDSLFAGALIHSLHPEDLPFDAKDGAKVAYGLYEKYGANLLSVMKETDHAHRLKEVFAPGELEFCCKVNSFAILPQYKDGIITKLNA